MADIDNFSSLDSLGPAFGKINQPSLDEQGLSAFEGQSLSMPKIDFPERDYLPAIPQSDNLNNQQINIRRNIVGEPSSPQPKGAGMSAKDFGKALGDYYEAKAGADQDYNEYARIYSYDAGPDGSNFYKRYSKWVSPERFSEIGFHPLRDNEAIYNSNATGWEGAKSMMMHSFWPLFKRGFTSGPKSLFKMMQGDFSPDTDDAKAFAEASAIGASTRGGFAGFMNNSVMSFGYTAGIITEALVEEAAGFLLAAPTGGSSLVATTANNARKIPSLLRGIKAIDKMGDGMKALNSTLKGLDNVNDARKFFNAAKVEKVTSNPLFRFANPLENITGAALKIAKNEDNLTGLARAYDIAKTGFGGFYGDVRAINMALSEARLEGGMTQNEVYNELYDNYYKEHGTAPSNEVQKDLLATAKEAGMTSLMWNSALIFGSNKIVLDNIVGRRGGPRNFLKSKTEELLNLEGGNVIKNMKDVTLKTGKKVAKPELEWRQKSLWNTVKSFKDQPLNKSLKYGVGYFKANLAEGLQENSQEVISEATKAYYMDSYSNDNLATHQYAKGLVTDAIKKQFSAQGFETFASGMVMGMFASPLNALPKAFSVGYNKIFDKEAYQKYKVARDSAGKNFVNSMSSVDIVDFFDNNLANYGMQSSAEDTRMSADEKQRRDASDGAFIMQMNTVMEKGMGDLYVQQLESLQGLTAEEIEEMVPSIPQGEGAKYIERLPETIDRAKRLIKKYDQISQRFPNPVNPKSLDKANPDYEEAAYTYKAWEVAKKNAIFFNEAFDNTLSRMASIQKDLATNSPIKNAKAGDINVLFDQKLLENELDILKSEIDGIKDTPGSKVEIAKKQKKADALKNISEKINDFRLQFVDRNRIARELIQKNKNLSQEQLSELIDEALGARTEESDKKVSDELQTAFKDYLKVVADLSDDVVFDNNIENAFEKFRDFYLLNGEKRALVEAVNLLHDPGGFIEHVNKNKAWMKDLYENRREYYENLKEQEFRKKEANDLLNHLASKGLYISYEDFIRWRDQNILPEEVYDDINKIVIKRSNPLYDELMQPFQMLSELQSKRTDLEIVNDSVRQELQELENDIQKRLEALPRTEKRVDLGSLDFGKSKTIKIEAVKSQLEDGDYVDLTYTAPEGITDTITLYKYEDQLRFNNEDGNVFADNQSLLLGTDSFSAAERYRITNEPDEAEVKAILEEYNLKKAAILEKAAEKGAVETVEKEESVIYNADTPLNAMPAELYNKLAMLFEEYAADNGMEDLIGDDYDMAFESFVRQDFMAARVIDEYNKEKNIAEAISTVPTVPTIIIAGQEYSLDDISEKDIQGYLKGMELELKNLEEKEDKTSEDNLRISKVKLDIRTINRYLSDRKVQGYTPEQKASIDLLNSIVELQDTISKGPKGYIVNNQVLRRVTSIIRQFETDEYTYAAEGDVKATFNTTIAAQGFSQESIDAFITELRKQKLPGFSEYTYRELQSELNNMLNEGTPSNEDLLNKVINTVSEKTYEESRLSGNYVDDQIRNVFDDVEPVFDEERITREAFDALFSADENKPGYVRSIKNIIDNEGLYILSRVKLKDGGERGLVLFDEEAGVAGEVDLIAVDRAGNFFIIDIKTGKEVKWRGFNVEGNKSSKKEIYTLQQTAYSNLLNNMVGKQAKISLLPIQVDYESNTGKITRAGRPTAKGALEEGKYRIPLIATEEIQAKIDSAIPRKITEVPVAPEEAPVENEDFETAAPDEDANIQAGPAEQIIDLDIETLREPIASATQEVLDLFKADFLNAIAQNNISAESVMAVQQLLDERQRELDSTTDVKLTSDNIKVGDELVAISSIFTDTAKTKVLIGEGETFVVESIDSDGESVKVRSLVKRLNPVPMSFAELNKMFKLKEEVMKPEVVEVSTAPLTKAEREFVEQSFENINDLLKDYTRKDALKKEADTQLTDVVDTELFDDVTSDC